MRMFEISTKPGIRTHTWEMVLSFDVARPGGCGCTSARRIEAVALPVSFCPWNLGRPGLPVLGRVSRSGDVRGVVRGLELKVDR